jgi:hypothetical protein
MRLNIYSMILLIWATALLAQCSAAQPTSEPTTRSEATADSTTEPTTGPEQVFRSALEMIRTVPGQDLAERGQWTDLKIEAVNDLLNEKVVGHSALLRIVVANVERTSGLHSPLRIRTEKGEIGSVDVFVWCYFREDQAPDLIGINSGDVLWIEGTVKEAYLQRGDDDSVGLWVNLTHSVIKHRA